MTDQEAPTPATLAKTSSTETGKGFWKKDSGILASCIALLSGLFVFLTYGSWKEAGDLDAMVLYRIGATLHQGGIEELLRLEMGSMHPPLLDYSFVAAFTAFGTHPWSSSMLGLILFLANGLPFFLVARKLSTLRVATLSTILFSLTPIVITWTFYPTNEAIISAALLWALYALLSDKWILLSVFLAVSIWTKQTSLIIPIAFILGINGFLIWKRNWRKNKGLILISVLAPVLSYIAMRAYFSFHDATMFNRHHNLMEHKSTLSTHLFDLLTFRFLNGFLFGNSLNAFVLNYQWLFFFTSIFGVWILAKNWRKLEESSKRAMIVLLLFFLGYTFVVGSFQIYTEPRYILPIQSSYLLFLPFALAAISKRRAGFLFISLLLALSLVRLYTSLDPVSTLFYKKTNIMGVEVFDRDGAGDSADNVAHNLQLLQITEKHNQLIRQALTLEADVVVSDTCWTFKTIEKLGMIERFPAYYPSFPMKRRLYCVVPEVFYNPMKFKISDLKSARVFVGDIDHLDIVTKLSDLVPFKVIGSM